MPNRYFTILILLAATALFSGMSQLELRAEEPRRAVVAMEMVKSHQYTMPTSYGLVYYNKPPLNTWLIAGIMKLSDSFDEWTIRLPGILASLLISILLFNFLRSRFDIELASLTSIGFLTSMDILFYHTVNSGELDLLFSLFVIAQTLCIYLFFHEKSPVLFLFFSYLFLILAFFTKGIPAIAFFGLTFLSYGIINGQYKKLFYPAHLIGVILFLFSVWSFFTIYPGHDAYYLQHLLGEAIEKTSTKSNLGQVLKHFIFFPLDFLKMILPWSLLLIPVIRRRSIKLFGEHAFVKFALIFILSNIWIYWISTGSKGRYLLPFVPFVLCILFYKAEENIGWFDSRKALLLMGLFFVMRIGYNVIGMPIQQNQLEAGKPYRLMAKEINQSTDNATIDIYSTDTLIIRPVRMAFSEDNFIEIREVPLIPFQLAYYLARDKADFVKVKTELVKGNYYLAFSKDVKDLSVNPLYRFVENWNNELMVIFKW